VLTHVEKGPKSTFGIPYDFIEDTAATRDVTVDKPAFETCLSHGIVLGSDGQKMSKSLRNYPDVTEVFDRDGSDAMRWFLMASPILRGGVASRFSATVQPAALARGMRRVLLEQGVRIHEDSPVRRFGSGDPVLAETTRSRPSASGSMTADCTAVSVA